MGEKKEMAPLDSVHSPCRWLRHFLQPLYLFPPMDFGCIMGHWFVKKDGALQASQVVPVVKNLPVNAGDTDSIPGLGRSPGEGSGNPLQYSCLESSMDRGLLSIESQRVRHNWTHTHARTYGVSSLSLCLPYSLDDVSCLSSLWRPAGPEQESSQAGVKAPSELISHSRGSSTDLITAPDGLCSLWLIRQWLSFSPGISARGWYFMWLQEIQLHQSSLTKGSILIQGVYSWYFWADVTIQRTWFFSSTHSGIFCPQSAKMAASASASCRNCRQKEHRHKKEDRMAFLLQQQSQPTGLLLPPLGHMLTPAMRNTVHLSISRGYIAVTRKIVVLLVMRRGQMLVSWWLEATAIWAGVNLPYTSRPRETSFSTVWWIILTIPNQTFLQS